MIVVVLCALALLTFLAVLFLLSFAGLPLSYHRRYLHWVRVTGPGYPPRKG